MPTGSVLNWICDYVCNRKFMRTMRILALICPSTSVDGSIRRIEMHLSRLTASAKSLNVHYLRKWVLAYLQGQEDWKFVMGIIRESGLEKREALAVLMPLKGTGGEHRSEALFS